LRDPGSRLSANNRRDRDNESFEPKKREKCLCEEIRMGGRNYVAETTQLLPRRVFGRKKKEESRNVTKDRVWGGGVRKGKKLFCGRR